MPLQNVSLPHDVLYAPLSRRVSQLLDEADRRIADFTRDRRQPIDNFVVCDFRLVDSALDWVLDQQLLTGQRFCEWGSGFGVVTMLAALRELDAYGIEVEADLVAQSQTLAEDLQIEAEFATGSFIPEGGEDLLEFVEDIEHIDTDSPSGYDELELEIADFDLFFAFPWPGEHRFWEAVFEHYAADGAMLLTYHGIERLKLQRLVR